MAAESWARATTSEGTGDLQRPRRQIPAASANGWASQPYTAAATATPGNAPSRMIRFRPRRSDSIPSAMAPMMGVAPQEAMTIPASSRVRPAAVRRNVGVQDEVIQNTAPPKNCAAASRTMLRFGAPAFPLPDGRRAGPARRGSRTRSHWTSAMAAAMKPTEAVAPRQPKRRIMAAAVMGPLTLPRP